MHYLTGTLLYSSLLLTHAAETTSHLRKNRLLTITDGEVGKPTIPHKLYFDSYRFPEISESIHNKYKENVQNTINKYKRAWNMENIEVETLTTEKCKEAISRVPIKGASSQLLRYFLDYDQQHHHICRIAVLFLHGGYFIQEELAVIEPYIPPNEEVSFVAVTNKEGLFNGPFLVSSQYHPLLYRALKKYILFVNGELEQRTASTFGEIMRSSYTEVTAVNPDQKGDLVLLTEEDLDLLQGQHDEYKQVEKQDGEGPFCNFAVVDNVTKKTYFFTRFPGAHAHHCDVQSTNDQQPNETAPEPPKENSPEPPKESTPETSEATPEKPKPADNPVQEETKIPHTLWFASRYELSKLQEQNQKHYDNILNTIKAYKSAWNVDNVEYRILDDRACMNAIAKLPMTGASSTLFDFYLKEFKDHPSKGFDICRAAVLFQNGGYFFNEEVEVIDPFMPKDNDVEFVGVKSSSGLFLPSFVASVAEHPVMQEVLTKFIMLALNKIQIPSGLSGGEIYRDAYNGVASGKSVLLLEKHLTVLDNEYEKNPKRNHKCSYVIYSPESKKIHFYTRMYVDGEYCVDGKGDRLLQTFDY